jgi:hypothetical protein
MTLITDYRLPVTGRFEKSDTPGWRLAFPGEKDAELGH